MSSSDLFASGSSGGMPNFVRAILTMFGVRTRDATETKSMVLYVVSLIALALNATERSMKASSPIWEILTPNASAPFLSMPQARSAKVAQSALNATAPTSARMHVPG